MILWTILLHKLKLKITQNNKAPKLNNMIRIDSSGNKNDNKKT